MRIIYHYGWFLFKQRGSLEEKLFRMSLIQDWVFLQYFFIVCQAESGEPCIFPFKYSGTTYTSCTSVDNDQPWCSTGNDEDGNYDTYGNCDMALCGNV